MAQKKLPPIILLVDDDPLILQLGRELLEHLGFRVETAKDAPLALAAFQRLKKTDLVILDHQLPGMNGYQLFQELRARSAGVRVLMASGFISPQDQARFQENGGRGVIYKPFRLAELEQRIRAVLGSDPGA